VLRTRVLSALVIGPVVGLGVWAGGWAFFTLMLAVAGVAGYEFCRMMQRGGHNPLTLAVLAIIVLFFLDAAFPGRAIVHHGLVWILVLSISWQIIRYRQGTTPTVDWALSITGGLYVGWLLSHFVSLRSLPDGLAWTCTALLVTWASDSGAYFVGCTIGRHKLCPPLSPGKTWEGIGGGLIGGLLAGAIVGTLAMYWLDAIGLTYGLLMGLLVAVVSPLGDLAVSMMKREVGVKDSGSIIPGHGGMLDRTDSLMFVVVITYYFATWVAR
jgi:phosphatidate cytidylyltransferase